MEGRECRLTEIVAWIGSKCRSIFCEEQKIDRVETRGPRTNLVSIKIMEA